MERFRGSEAAYGTYCPNTGRAWQIKARPTQTIYQQHLNGIAPLAIYPLVRKSSVNFAVIDFDEKDGNLPKDAVRCASHHGFYPLVEVSRGKGYHLWFFFTQPVEAWKARALLSTLLSEIEYPNAEVFPKQDAVRNGVGNCINLPLFGKLTAQQKTVFVNGHFQPLKDQWRALARAKQHSSKSLDNWIQLNQLEKPKAKVRTTSVRRTYGLMPCFQQMLTNGVSFYQRVACFRLATQLRKAGISYDIALHMLEYWALKNTPDEGKSPITLEEITNQVRCAYQTPNYLSCGCDEEPMRSFCSKECPVFTM